MPPEKEAIIEVTEIVQAEEEIPVVPKEEKWTPKTALGKKVVSGEITDIGVILDNGYPILEKGNFINAKMPIKFGGHGEAWYPYRFGTCRRQFKSG